MTKKPVIVIGGGASGMMAAGRAAELGADVLLLEKTGSPGKKILISGQARCNLTNSADLESFIAMYGSNGRFLYGAVNKFFRDDLLIFLKRYGVSTKTEPGGRIFPASDDARDIVAAFERYLADGSVRIQTGADVTGILVEKGRAAGVQSRLKAYPAGAVILAAGGATYPDTGSTGDGYRLAAGGGPTVTRLRPSLVPLVVSETR